MKSLQKNCCAFTLARDFLAGLALFLSVFSLAMMDSRASLSAPAFVSTPLKIAQARPFTPIKFSTRTLSMHVSENGASDVTASNSALHRPGGRVLREDIFLAPLPLVKKKSALPGSGNDAEVSREDAKLAMTLTKPGAGAAFSPGISKAGDRTRWLGVMAMIFAAMTALTLGLWRHLNVSVAPRRSGRRV